MKILAIAGLILALAIAYVLVRQPQQAPSGEAHGSE
jgi:hypothetical protein